MYCFTDGPLASFETLMKSLPDNGRCGSKNASKSITGDYGCFSCADRPKRKSCYIQARCPLYAEQVCPGYAGYAAALLQMAEGLGVGQASGRIWAFIINFTNPL